jgi:hypothetical protein
VEAAGIATVALSMIPDLTAAAGGPRVAAIEFPFGRPLGQPNDAATQRAVLRATLDVLRDAAVPGTIVHLPFDWPEAPDQVHWHPKALPITQLLARSPSWFQRLAAGDIRPRLRGGTRKDALMTRAGTRSWTAARLSPLSDGHGGPRTPGRARSLR